MLTCVDANRLIVRCADGGPLDPPEQMSLDEHLAGCASCRQTLAEQRAVADVLRARPMDAVSRELTARIRERLDDEAGWFGLIDWRAWTFRLAPAAAALALAAFLTADRAAAGPVSLEEWAVSTAGSSSAAALLWDSDVSSDSVLQEMLGVDPAAAEGTRDGR